MDTMQEVKKLGLQIELINWAIGLTVVLTTIVFFL